MFGGPWLGVLVFVVIAIAMGWGVSRLFHAMGQVSAERDSHGDSQHDAFDPEEVFVLQRDLLLGYLADGRVTLLPARDDLPAHAPGRKRMPTLEQFRDQPSAYPDLIGIVQRDTRVRFVEVIQDPDNPQTSLLVLVRIIDGPYAQKQPVLGMHLESADRDQQTGRTRYRPRNDLFTPNPPNAGPVQSTTP